MANAPKYSIGDTVYLRESAISGFLEAYVVEYITYESNSTIKYQLATHIKAPDLSMTMGDRITGRVKHPLYIYESELIDYCDALALAIDKARRQLAYLESLQNSCGDITT